MSGNSELAGRAAQLAANAERGSLDRKRYGAVTVALETTASVPAARKVLVASDLAGAVQAGALAALDQLTEISLTPEGN